MTIRVLTFNAWTDHPRHPSWSLRRDASAAVFCSLSPDIAGGQEYSIRMLRDIEKTCGDWLWIGAGRDDGCETGEFTPVFYRKETFALLEGDTFWLSPDETFQSPGWNARCRRTVTWAHLKARRSGEEFFMFNTHFDHFGGQARKESARLLLRKVTALSNGLPVLVTGDLNCRPGSGPYRTLIGAGGDPALLKLNDAREESDTPPAGPAKTWKGLLWGLGSGRLDYIFCSDHFRVSSYRTVVDDPALRAASDHLPVIAELVIRA